MLPTLTDGNILLRPWSPDDAPVRVQAGQDPEIMRFTSVPQYVDEEAALGWIAAREEEHALRRSTYFAVEHAGECVGSAGLVAYVPEHNRAEVGYWLLPPFRGAGLAGRALALLSGYAFGTVRLSRLDLFTNVDNHGSMRVAESVGYCREGLLRSFHQLADGQREDLVLFGLVAP